MSASTRNSLDKTKDVNSKKRKRLSIESDQTTREIKNAKVSKQDSFTEVEFKVALRNQSATFSGFEKFIEAADRWPGDAQYDIVEGFLRSSPECSEIFQILEGGRRKIQELQLIFRCFEKILLRVAEDLEKYYTTGQHIVRKLLTTQLSSIYFTLSVRHKSSQIKTALKLLVAMVMLGPSAGKTVLNQIDLNHANIKPLFYRRDSKDDEDVRTCLLHFIVAFLLAGDNELIRRLADTKGFLANVFQGIVFDRVATIQLVLSTFLEKIILNPVVSKTSKVHIFTESSLKQLGQLYNWKGPGKWKEKDQEKTEGEIEEEEDIIMDEDRQTVAEMVHKFLTELCSSYKFGISFMDKTYGTSGRNQNHMLTSFLSYLSTISHKALVQELIVKILEASPDQMKHFLPHIAHSLSPRATARWVNTVNFLCKIYEAQPSEPHILKSSEHVPVNKIISIFLVHTLPQPQILNTVLSGVKNKSIAVSYMSLGFVKVIAHKCGSIVRGLTSPDCPLRTVYSLEELADIAATFKESVMKGLPDSSEIFQCLDRLQLEGKPQAADLLKLCQARPSDVMVRIEQVLCLYQDLHPTLLLDHPQGLVKLLEGVALDTASHLATENEAEGQNETEGQNEAEDQDAAAREVTESELLPQLYLLKLLSGTDARRLPWGKEDQSGHTLIYQLFSMVTQVENDRIKEIALQLICKLLDSTGLFDTFTDEIYIWMKHLQSQVSQNRNRSDLLTLVSKVMMTYMTNPYPYMDRVADLVSEAIVMETGETTLISGKEMLDRKVEEILSMDLDCLEDETEDKGSTSQTVARKQPFCPMLLTALDLISNLGEAERADITVYISSVILDVFHIQTDPSALCLLMKSISESYVVGGLLDYISMWLPPYKEKKAKKQLLSLPNKVQGHLMQYLLGDQSGTIKVTECENIDIALTSTQCLLYVKLLLEKDKTETTRSKLVHILAFLTHILSPDANVVASETVQNSHIALPAEFSELEVKKSTSKETLEEIYRTILENPTVKSWFLASKQGSSSLSTAVTEFVRSLLIFIKVLNIGMNLKEEVTFYVDTVLQYVTLQRKSTSDNADLAVELLNHMMDFLDNEKSIRVLNTMLDVEEERSSVDDSVVDITNQILKSITTQSVLRIQLSSGCVHNLVKLSCLSQDPLLMDDVVNLFKKFPNLSVLCSEETVAVLLETPMDTKLLEILVTNNVELRTCVETWLVRKPKWLKQKRKQMLSLVVTCLCFKMEPTDVVSSLRTAYMPDILSLSQAGEDISETEAQKLTEILKHFVRLNVIEKKACRKLEKNLDTLLHSDSPLQTHHIEIFQMLHGCQATDTESQNQDSRRKVLRFCVQGLVNGMKEKEKRNLIVAKKIIKVIEEFSEEEIQDLVGHLESLEENWPHLLKGCLKYLYTDPGALKLLTHLLPSLYETEQEVGCVSIETIVAMVTSHSSFLPVMFNEESPEAKEPLLDLLIQLVTLRPGCCEKDHVGIFLGSYGATLSLTDQKILKLMHIYEKNGMELSDFKPFLWGEKAIEHHTLRKSIGDTLLKQPTMSQVLTNLEPEKVTRTILNFALRRTLQTLETRDAVEYKSMADCYDPCFLLPLFSHLLAPAAIVDCRKFIERDCLGLAFAALSSHDQAMRRAACHVIERFKEHVEGAKFMEMDQIKYIIGLLKDSLAGSKTKLACTVTIFLARAVKIMLKPDDHMYGLINIFLLLKPNLDVGNVPEFYKLFNSSALEYKTERQWILSLLLDGLRETADYRIFEKRYTFKLLQSFYDSDLSDTSTQLKVLQILQSACKERTIAIDLVRYHGFLTWIAGIIQKLKPGAVEHVSHLVNIVTSLWSSLSKNHKYDPVVGLQSRDKEVTAKTVGDEGDQEETEKILKNKAFVQPAVTCQVLTLLQTLLWHMRDVEAEIIQTFIEAFSSVVDHLEYISACLKESNDKLILPVVSLVDLLLLLLHGGKIIPSPTPSIVYLNVIAKLGYRVSLLSPDKGGIAKGNKSGKKRSGPHVATALQVEEEVEDKPDNQEDGKGVADTDSKTDKVNEINLEENTEKGTERSLEVAQKYADRLLQIVTHYRPETGNNSKERTAGVVAVISWCLQQLELTEDINTICLFMRWLNSYSERNSVIVQVIASSSQVSVDLFQRLLKICAVSNGLRVTTNSSDHDVHQTHDSLLRDLNEVLEKVAAVKVGQPHEESVAVLSVLEKHLNSGACSSEEKSVVLRKFFMRPDAEMYRPSTLEAKEVMEMDIDSGDNSESEDVQDVNQTPKVKAKNKDKTRYPKAKTASESKETLKKTVESQGLKSPCSGRKKMRKQSPTCGNNKVENDVKMMKTTKDGEAVKKMKIQKKKLLSPKKHRN